MHSSTFKLSARLWVWLALTLTLGGAVSLRLPPSAIAQTGSVWRSLQTQEGHFSILMPGESDRTTQPVRILGQSATKISLSATQWQHDARYQVSWIDLPDSLRKRGDRQRTLLFEDTLTQLAQELDGQLLQETDLTLAGHPGKQYRLSHWVEGEAYLVTSRAFWVGPRFFQISVALPERFAPGLEGSTQGFLKSFRMR